MKKFILFLLVFVFLTVFKSEVSAQSCSTNTYSGTCVWYGCYVDPGTNLASCTNSGGRTWRGTCGPLGPSCVYEKAVSTCTTSGSRCVITNCQAEYAQCGVASTPTPGGGGGGPAPAPPPSCNNRCAPPAANCGVYGYQNGSGSCAGGQMCCWAPPPLPPASCTISISPNPISVQAGSSVDVVVNQAYSPGNPPGGYSCNVQINQGTQFASYSGGKVTGIATGNANLSGYCGWPVFYPQISNRWIYTIKCGTNAPIRVTAPGPWWQAVNGDVISQGSLSSQVPAGLFFMLPGAGTYPGVAVYNSLSGYSFSNNGLNAGSPSEKGWLAESTINSKKYGYDYYKGITPTLTVFNNLSGNVGANTLGQGGTVSPDGYFYYKSVGDLTLSGNLTIPGTRKVILMVENGNLTINNNIQIANSGEAFFMVLTNGNITLNSSVTNLEGIFLTDGTFSTGAGNKQLTVKGSTTALGGANLERDLGDLNGTTGSEVFEFDPILVMNYPASLTPKHIVWKEIAP